MRPNSRARVIAHKKNRQLPIGAHATLHFEDALTMQYRVQEMLRTGACSNRSRSREELDV